MTQKIKSLPNHNFWKEIQQRLIYAVSRAPATDTPRYPSVKNIL